MAYPATAVQCNLSRFLRQIVTAGHHYRQGKGASAQIYRISGFASPCLKAWAIKARRGVWLICSEAPKVPTTLSNGAAHLVANVLIAAKSMFCPRTGLRNIMSFVV